MKPNSETDLIDLERKVFHIKNEPMPQGAWWWWFWLFFFNNPKNPEKPRQLMILWSTKNEREISCNHLRFRPAPPQDRNNLNGIVAAWYFDGGEMHHNFLLEQCNLRISDKEISSDSTIPSSFSINKTKNTVKIGNDFEFIAGAGDKHDFVMPTYKSNIYLMNRGYSILRLNHLNLSGRINNEKIHGSAYFQRVFVNAPTPSWYWGIFHFEGGGILSYYNPYLLGKSLKEDISFFDGEKIHNFDNVGIMRSRGDKPIFTISGETEDEKINFTVTSYSHSSWTFRKKVLGIIPNKLVYNEYPASISDLRFTNKKTGEDIVLADLGKAVGNAEHTTGFLI